MNGNRLMIKNLDCNTTEEHIENLFSTYGDVCSIRISRFRGSGFVEMMSAAEARRVRDNLNGMSLWGRAMKIEAMGEGMRHRMMFFLGMLF